MLKRKFEELKKLVRSLPVNLNHLNSYRPKLIFNFWLQTSAKAGRLIFLIKKSLFTLISNQIQSSTPHVKLLRAAFGILIVGLYLFISPNMAVKAVRQERVLAEQSKKTVLITSEIVAEKIPEFQTPVHGSISTWFSGSHPGIDIPNSVGTEVKSADGGIVTFASWTTSGHGNLVIVRHTLGFETYYAHLSTIQVKLGQEVSAGEVIGNVGSTGNSTGSHLHFEIHQNGVPLNPLKFIQS